MFSQAKMGVFFKTLRNTVIFFIFAGIFVNIPNLPPDSTFEEYSVQPPPPFEGLLAVNDALNGGERLFENEIHGPEGLAVHENVLYTGLANGRIVALKDNKLVTIADLSKPCDEKWDISKCGHLLGIKFDKTGNLFAADSYFGIYKVNITTGTSSLIIPSSIPIAGELPLLPNALAIDSDGSIYWSDSSTQFPVHRFLLLVLGDSSGRLIKTNPKTGQSEVLISNLRFANGVFLADDESYVAVVDGYRFRILRHWLKGPKKGKSEIFIDNLPGIPDNFSPYKDGGFIVSLMISREWPDLVGTLAAYPNVRKFCARTLAIIELALQKMYDMYPTDTLKKAAHFATHFYTSKIFVLDKHYIALFYDKNGNLIKSLHSTDGSLSMSSDIAELGGYYYLGSTYNNFLGRKKISK